MDDKIEIGIIGAGAVGGVLAVMLKDKDYKVELTKHLKNDLTIDNCVALEVTGVLGSHAKLIPVVTDNKFTSKKDIIFVCTKSFDLDVAIKQALLDLQPKGVVVAIQNVMNLEEIQQVCDLVHFVGLYIDWISHKTSPNQFNVEQSGAMHIGVYNEQAKTYLPIIQQILSCVAPTDIQLHMPEFVLSRFILNTTVSCMCAITGEKLGDFLKYKQAKKIFIELIREQINLGNHVGYAIPPYNNMLDYYKFVEKSIDGIFYRKTMFTRLINQNGQLISSLLIGLENNKETELDFMLRKVVMYGKKFGISTPYSCVMADMLDAIRDGNHSIYLENIQDERFLKIK